MVFRIERGFLERGMSHKKWISLAPYVTQKVDFYSTVCETPSVETVRFTRFIVRFTGGYRTPSTGLQVHENSNYKSTNTTVRLEIWCKHKGITVIIQYTFSMYRHITHARSHARTHAPPPHTHTHARTHAHTYTHIHTIGPSTHTHLYLIFGRTGSKHTPTIVIHT